MAGGHAWQGDVHGRGGFARGVCMVGGMHGRGDVWRGTCVAGGMHGRGACMAGGACVARETATAVGSMHPTGMHSCFQGMFTRARLREGHCQSLTMRLW